MSRARSRRAQVSHGGDASNARKNLGLQYNRAFARGERGSMRASMIFDASVEAGLFVRRLVQ
jgi:hypothetical protein